MSGLLLALLAPASPAPDAVAANPLGGNPHVSADAGDEAKAAGDVFKSLLASADQRALSKIPATLKGSTDGPGFAAVARDVQAQLLKDKEKGKDFAGLATPGLIPHVDTTNYVTVAAVVQVTPAPKPLVPDAAPLPAFAPVVPGANDMTAPADEVPAPSPEPIIPQAAAVPQAAAAPVTVSPQPAAAKAPETASLPPVLPASGDSENDKAQKALGLDPLPKLPSEDAAKADPLKMPLLTSSAVANAATPQKAAALKVTATPLSEENKPDEIVATDEAALAPVAMAANTAATVTPLAAADGEEEMAVGALLPQGGKPAVKTDNTKPVAAPTPSADVKDIDETSAFGKTVGKSFHQAVEGMSEKTAGSKEQAEAQVTAASEAKPLSPSETVAPSFIANATPASQANLVAAPQNFHLVHVQVRPDLPLADQVSVHIKTAAADGLDKIHIQLHPEDLGKVEISLNISHDHTATVQVIADTQETLDMLSRNAHVLERSLSEAGIKASGQSLQFELRDQNRQAQNGNGQNGEGRPRGGYREAEGSTDTTKIQQINDNGMYRLVATSGINIRV